MAKKKKRKEKDAFQLFADLCLMGNRGLAELLFWIGLFMMPPVAIGLLILFSIIASARKSSDAASAAQYRQTQRPGAAPGAKYAAPQYPGNQYPPRTAAQGPVYDVEYRDVPAADPAPPPKKAAPAPAAQKNTPPAPPKTGRPEADSIIKACNEFIWQAGKTLPEIDDVSVRARAQQTIALVKGIEEWLVSQPETAKGAQRLADYYLPTALKLLQTYISVDNNPGPNAKNICKEIDRTLEKFNEALANLQNDLLDTTALDVAAEISAMEQMLGSEGLVNEFNILQPGEAQPKSTQPAASGQEEP